jgi:ribosomal protein S12 methylthiotransferase
MRRFHEGLVGRTLPVLIDGYDADAQRLVGRTWADAPEVDGRVLLPKGTAAPGTFVDATITQAHDYELTGGVAAAKVKPAKA